MTGTREHEFVCYIDIYHEPVNDGDTQMPSFSEVLHIALDLSAQDRAALAERLLASLDDLSEAEAETLWAAEAERRLEAYREGRAESIEAATVHEKAERLYK